MAIDYTFEHKVHAKHDPMGLWRQERQDVVPLERDRFDRSNGSSEADEKAHSAANGLFEFASHIVGYETLQKFLQYLVPPLLELHSDRFITALRNVQKSADPHIYSEVLLALGMVEGPVALRSRLSLLADAVASKNASIRESAQDALELIHDYAAVASE